MPRPLAHLVHALCAAIVLAAVMPAFAQQKPASLVGSTREQVVEKFGEPKSILKAGAREVLFFPRLKLTLRNGVVIDSEEVVDDTPGAKHDATAPTPAPTTPPPTPQPAAPASSDPAPAVAPPPQSTATPPAAPVREGPLEIKSVKSGSSSTKSAPRTNSTPVAPAPATSSATPPVTTVKTTPTAGAETRPIVPSATAPATPVVSAENKTGAVAAPNHPVLVPGAEHPVVVEETSVTEPATTKPVVDPKKKFSLLQRWRRRRDAETEDDSVQIFSAQSYVIAAIIMIGGAGVLWWRRNQRKLALVATAVSHTPFEAAVATDSAGQFTADFVGRLSAKKFERLVAAYYAKTGVVAERTNAAPDSPVQIKIFWKGEPKPFAGVQCHSNPPTLIGPKPLMDLFTALTAAEIRRGYVVTNGKFNVEARDFAEEKHFTLLPGDIFLEKLNALPPAARAELLKETNAEDLTASAPGLHAT